MDQVYCFLCKQQKITKGIWNATERSIYPEIQQDKDVFVKIEQREFSVLWESIYFQKKIAN